ncbi:hypothetical protein MKK69_29420 [Methylobacterium sp. J-026]|uniref:hypothetical protein n=1 Tax=Methylobacterium sp. J-026 TaxID=2836624 RepID=UPI001FB96DA3|nr:hypothetical protein [Methylobacterium sp. J-026]MCJ2138121.1 hypothetical protein [Methylobacterium sp. J-026]
MGLPPGIRPRREAPARRLKLRDMRRFIDNDQGDSTRGRIAADRPGGPVRVPASADGRRASAGRLGSVGATIGVYGPPRDRVRATAADASGL